MSKIDAEQIKASVDIVDIIGKFVELKPQGSGFKGCCPFHDEKDGSFNVNPTLQTYKCFGCDAQGDVIDFISNHKSLDFKAACEFLGADIPEGQKPPKREKPAKKAKTKPVPLKYEDAKNHYTRDIMQDRADYVLNKDKEAEPHIFMEPAWPFKNENGDVELVAARFETESGHKTVLSMYWNGSTIKLAGYPVLLFNRDMLAAHPEKPVLMVEGEKSAEAAKVLTDFVAVTWNGGHAKVKDVDLSPLKNREVFIYPDDDQQKFKGTNPRAGQIMPAQDQPGIKTANQIKKKLPHAKIVTPLPAAREIKESGADIVEALECLDVDELTAYIHTHVPVNVNGKKPETSLVLEPQADKPPTSSLVWPFHVLGVADDGKAYIIGTNDRLYPLNPMAFSKTQLFNLADLEYWRGAYEQLGTGQAMWEQAISDLIQTVNTSDFDPDRMRGRGAWRESDGRICYHDGRKTVGEYDESRLFLRRPRQEIGLKAKHATPEQRRRIAKSAAGLTFRSDADCVRILGWSLLAPFAGGLPWRSACLLTAASGTGKTTILNGLVSKLSKSKICSGESTSAGVRQNTGVDSCSVIIDEAEGDSPKKQQNREDCFSLMRQSTSDDAPDIWKGTIDGKGMHFKLRSMFMFVSIDPTVNSEADENRIFRVNLKKPGYLIDVWLKKEKELKESLTPEICDGVRAYVWSNLAKIIKLAETIARQAQIVAKVDSRTAFAESLLLSAYIAVFRDELNPSTNYINDFVKKFYSLEEKESRRNENEEMLDIILDSIVRDGSASYSVRELLNAIENGFVWSNKDDQKEGEDREEQLMPSHYARQLVGRYGVGLDADKNIAIAKNHQEVMKMLDKGRGYHQQLARHPRLVDKSKNVSLGSRNTKGCVVIGWDNDSD